MFGLQFNTWGMGLGHMAQVAIKPCDRCQGAGEVGDRAFPVCCPDCKGAGVEVAADGTT